MTPDDATATLRVASLHATVYRAPVATPVVTSFGVMHDRPVLLVRAEAPDGLVGWGEVWCNFPSVGAEHRARLINRVLAGQVVGRAFADPQAAFTSLSDRTAVLALQSGEPGPFAQCIAGVDIALWDLHARRAGQPLWRMLGGSRPDVPLYASGLNPDDPARLAAARHGDGYRAFKLKVGFGADRDRANLRDLRAALGDVPLMVDANQAWTLPEAIDAAGWLAPFAPDWLEEPLRADRPWAEWQTLRAHAAPPLAAGENLAGPDAFAAAAASGAVAVLQPDIAKWGGFSGTVPVARAASEAGLRVCPHWLGGGIGLLASAHLLAGVGADGLLEVDANPNPLRELLCGRLADIRDGSARLGEEPGLGIEPDLQAIAEYRVPD